jgi:T6SS, Phospholipase effector Tle1-like, catalytic domain
MSGELSSGRTRSVNRTTLNKIFWEVWFAGVHSDVGGSYPESESQLSQIALKWMLCEAALAGLLVDPDRKADCPRGQATLCSTRPRYEKPARVAAGLLVDC